MGHLMETINPAAVTRLASDDPLPGVGDVVLFFPRPSEIRAGKPSVPALVLKSDEDNRRLDLLVVNDADDFQSLQNIPMRIGDDRGWEVRPGADTVSVERFEKFQSEMAELLLGDNAKPDSGSMLDAMADIYKRLETLEAAEKQSRKRK